MSLLLLRLFSGCGERRLLSSCGLLIAVASLAEYGCQGMWFSVVTGPGLQSTGSRFADQVLSGMWDLPGSGIESVSPALAGRFFTIDPPKKPRT